MRAFIARLGTDPLTAGEVDRILRLLHGAMVADDDGFPRADDPWADDPWAPRGEPVPTTFAARAAR